jgi:hypothetical protein
MRNLLITLLVLSFIVSCKNKSAGKKTTDADSTLLPHDSVTLILLNKDSLLPILTNKVLTALKNKDYNSLALLIHPDKGVRFSPYAYIDTLHDKVIHTEFMVAQADHKKQGKILWGTKDPTDDPINLTIDKYIDEFVYDVDFLYPEKFKINEFIGGGNTQNNLLTVYEGSDFTESYFSGFDKAFEGMDWRSLRLVFKQKDDKYFLIGIVHDSWSM